MESDFERVELPDGFVFYRIFSEYAKETVAIEPSQLLKLLTILNDNEDVIQLDVRQNTLLSKQGEQE